MLRCTSGYSDRSCWRQSFICTCIRMLQALRRNLELQDSLTKPLPRFGFRSSADLLYLMVPRLFALLHLPIATHSSGNLNEPNVTLMPLLFVAASPVACAPFQTYLIGLDQHPNHSNATHSRLCVPVGFFN